MLEKLWGDIYYDPVDKTWINTPFSKNEPEPLSHTFVQLILKPIMTFSEAIMERDEAQTKRIAKSLKLEVDEAGFEHSGKKLYKILFGKWMNA